MKSAIRLAPFALLCLFSLFNGATAEENATDHFLQGRKLLEQQNYTAALGEFQKADALKPDLPEVQYGLGACLNALGKFQEAKGKLEAAFRLLQNRPRVVGANWGPIDIGYYAMLADIQANLGESDAAVDTVAKYKLPDSKGSDQTKAGETLKTVKKGLSAKLIANGLKCLGSGDLECGRRAFAQAEKLESATPETLLAIAKGVLSLADRMSVTTDDERAKRSDLCRMAADVTRRLPASELEKPEAKRVLARALSGTKNSSDYQQSIKILTALWDSSQTQKPPDTSILLELTTGYLNGEEWELGARSATKFIEIAPAESRAQGYCKRSFAEYKLGHFQNALDDGAKCTNADGTPRQLKHLELSRQEIQKQKAAEANATAQKAAIENECMQLSKEIEWAKAVQDPDLDALVPIIARLESGKAKCKGHLENADLSEICRAGIHTASNPANLSLAKAEELKGLETLTSKYMKLCGAYLTEKQKADVQDALKRIASNLSTSP